MINTGYQLGSRGFLWLQWKEGSGSLYLETNNLLLPTIYLSVQLSLICVFQALDLDFLCVARTAPHNSWRNPVERMMSILNIGLQGVGLMRKEMGERTKSELSKCNNVAQVRAATEKMPELATEIKDSIEPVKVLLSDVNSRLKLKEKVFKVGQDCETTDIEYLKMSFHI